MTGSSEAMDLQPRVITIPAAMEPQRRRQRVAAYARVSSDSADQLHSYAAQVAYFTRRIQEDPEQVFVEVYADRGVTGTSVEKRAGFRQMMEDCRRGRIDRILVKSISRFGRNTKESLEAVRELSSLGISVLFEEQNIDTGEMAGETLTAVFAALAQKESEAISERMRHSYRMRMQRGAFLTCSAPFGYRLTGGVLEIIEEEAAVVRRIFEDHLSGTGMDEIARVLTAQSIPTKRGHTHWHRQSIQRILTNERYVGDSLGQKAYTTQTLPRRRKKNRGEETQYLLPNSHPAIISREVFEKVQILRESRQKDTGGIHSTVSRRIRCGCGSRVRAKCINQTWYWNCCAHDRHETCPLMPVPETEVQEAFLRLYDKLRHRGRDVLTALIQDLQTARNGRLLWSEDIVAVNGQIADIFRQEQLLTQLKEQGAVDPDIFISRTGMLAQRKRDLKRKRSQLLEAEDDHTLQKTQELLDILEAGPDLPETFDEGLLHDLVETVILQDETAVRFRLLNGLEVTEKIERSVR